MFKNIISSIDVFTAAANFGKMKRIYSLTALLFVSITSFSQLSVGPSIKNNTDHYIFAKETVLYVAEDIHLNKNIQPVTEANIYLRNGAQLIQGKNQKSANTGNGLISVFQTGTSNAYDYDYWAAPVGNSVGKNGLFGITMLYAAKTETYSSPAANTGSLNGISNPLSISNRWIYTFTGFDYLGWHYIGSATQIPAGYGFSMKGVDGTDLTLVDSQPNNQGNAQRYDFRGRPNSGLIEIQIDPDEIALVGNPYPSSLDLSLFLMENSGEGTLNTGCYGTINRKSTTTGIAYFWDSVENGSSHYLEDYIGGYGAFSPIDPCTSGIYEPPIFKSYGTKDRSTGEKGKDQDRRFLPIGQGFMVQGANGGVVEFKNSHRIFRNDKSTNGLKMAEKASSFEPTVIPKVKLEVIINDEYVRGLSLGFWPTATSETDIGMDAIAYDRAHADIGWLQNEDLYVIDVRPFEETDEIPLAVIVEDHKATYNITLSGWDNFELNNIYILDSEKNTYHSIKYESFEIVLEPGNYNGRFHLTFNQKMADIDLPIALVPEVEEKHTEFSIFQNNHLGELEIMSTDLASVRSVGIFDLQGKRIFFRSNFGNRRSVSINTQNFSNAVYIVKVTDSNNSVIRKKVMILNTRKHL